MASLCRAYLVQRILISSVTWWQGMAIYQHTERKYGPDNEDDDMEDLASRRRLRVFVDDDGCVCLLHRRRLYLGLEARVHAYDFCAL